MKFGAEINLRAMVERIENMLAEKAEIAAHIRDLFAEAKSRGFDTKALRAVIKLRAMDADKRREQAAILQTYCAALGLDAPLFSYAREVDAVAPASAPDADARDAVLERAWATGAAALSKTGGFEGV